jgi:heme/copper-type cytochrome/quinol oxidase subunit 2
VKRLATSLAVAVTTILVLPAAALAHDAPESAQSNWVMTDWMMDLFFIFGGLAFVAFVAAWKAGMFHELDTHASIPLYVEEEDYYTPDWALEEEEWANVDA